jgi:hypothetical protein
VNIAIDPAKMAAPGPLFMRWESRHGPISLEIPRAMDAPDWLVICRATWGEGRIRLAALEQVRIRGLELSARPECHQKTMTQFADEAVAQVRRS